jgi:hypothetical protein
MSDGGGESFDVLTVLNGAIFGLLVGFVIFLVLRLFAKRKAPTNWEAAGIKLPVRRWYYAAAVLLLVALTDRPIYEEISRRRLEASIGVADPTRLSVLIPDFNGPGGPEAADTVQTMLQSSLGSGVQVIRLPALKAGARYGDAEKKLNQARAESLFCAARYGGDVVIWGTNHPGSQQIGVNFTARSPHCYPSNCGITESRYPKLYNLADAHNPQSELAKMLSGSVVTALSLATRQADGAARAAQCLNDLR